MTSLVEVHLDPCLLSGGNNNEMFQTEPSQHHLFEYN